MRRPWRDAARENGEALLAQCGDIANGAGHDDTAAAAVSRRQRAAMAETSRARVAVVDNQHIARLHHLQGLVGHQIVAGEAKDGQRRADHADVLIHGPDRR